MSDDKVIQEAVKAAGITFSGEIVWCGAHPGPPIGRTIESVCRALQSAGLLVTDLHRRALEACEELSMSYDGAPKAIRACQEVGRESLAARKPKPRWEVRIGGWFAHVVDTQAKDRAAFSGTKAEAEAVVATLNRLDAEAR